MSIAQGLIAIGVALAIGLSTIGVGIGQGLAASMKGQLQSVMILAMGFMEALAIYGLVIAFMLIAKM